MVPVAGGREYLHFEIQLNDHLLGSYCVFSSEDSDMNKKQ